LQYIHLTNGMFLQKLKSGLFASLPLGYGVCSGIPACRNTALSSRAAEALAFALHR
jgi:hypothetical protein